MKNLFILSLLNLSACTNYIYEGRLNVPDKNGTERESIIYWHKTEPLIGQVKGGPATLMTECGSSIQFDERPEGILYRGNPADDADPATGNPVALNQLCGKFLNIDKFADSQGGELRLSILCSAYNNDFSTIERFYLQPSREPYAFQVAEEKNWSFFGQELKSPVPPVCQERE